MPEKEIHGKLSMAMKMSLKSLFQAVISLATAPAAAQSLYCREEQPETLQDDGEAKENPKERN